MNSKQKNTRNLYPSAFVLLHLLFFALPVKAQNAEETLPIYEISGKVTLGTGETGLAGCQVFLYKGALHEIARTTTDGNGWFTFGFLRVEPGPVRFLTAPPYDFITVPEVTLHLGKEREIRIRIPAVCEFEVSDLFSLAVQGFIRAGSPEQSLEGLEVVISRSEGHGIAQTRTNRGGFFHLHPKSLPPGRYDIAFRTGSELIPETTRSIELTNRNLLHEMNLLLPIRIEEPVYPGMVLGRVLLEPFGDMGIANATIAIGTGEWRAGSKKTGGRGYYQFDPVYLPRGPVWLRASSRNPFVGVSETLILPTWRNGRIELMNADVRLPLSPVMIPAMILGIAFLTGTGFLITKRWILPEWREIKNKTASL